MSIEETAEKIVARCDHDPPERVDDPDPRLFSDMESERVDSALFKLWQKGIVDAEWDSEDGCTRWHLSHFGVELCERGLVRPYVAALEGELNIDASPAALEVLER